MVSIIIPTYNEEKVIKDCLDSLSKQSYKDFEVVVVDDDSTDETLGKVATLIANHESQITVLRQKHLGPGAARNLGAKHAKGDILAFVDADMTFDRNFLKNLVKPIISGKSKGTFSKFEYVSNWENVWARCWNINENWEDRRRHPKKYPEKQKVFRAILKKEFDRVGGFTPGGYTDDYSLAEKLGVGADSAAGAVFYHKNPETLTEVFRQARWSGKRKYKLGYLGFILAILRASLPASILIGVSKSVLSALPAFLAFKVVYDFGIVIGILEYIVTSKGSK